ncbi:rho GDP-dissociation inhibitor 1-like [Alnus glutinosa]|uniref:rho GDP-dissociation inhibitor 1-like n=1 Tax=Alnus glutinosa TaxID=3517 RepID=UPI002D782C1C|nr:rho GDP-dissociation inhibitor 1-like [Alnus glutinosa]
MSAAVGAISATKDVSFNPQMEEEELKNNKNSKTGAEPSHEFPHTDGGHEDDDDDDEKEEEHVTKLIKSEKELDLGPQISLKEQLEKDKDDESLRKWKEQLLGNVDLSAVGETKEPEVKIQSLTILCRGRPDLVLPIPFVNNSKSSLFSLKEGSRYSIKFTFTVSSNIVSGLKYTNVVWKTGVRVDNSKRMLGTFSPQQQPYTFEMEEETTPSGMFARGSYYARTKFVDDDGKCYLDASYCFEIQKSWPKPF